MRLLACQGLIGSCWAWSSEPGGGGRGASPGELAACLAGHMCVHRAVHTSHVSALPSFPEWPSVCVRRCVFESEMVRV